MKILAILSAMLTPALAAGALAYLLFCNCCSAGGVADFLNTGHVSVRVPVVDIMCEGEERDTLRYHQTIYRSTFGGHGQEDGHRWWFQHDTLYEEWNCE